jgi:ABC-type transport system involved in cytochrome c biogenesis permease subunit
MGRLVAVLDSNFWLSTHVVSITIGYGAAAVAGLTANAYLFVRLFKPNNKDLIKSISKNFIGVTLLALLFCITGTILGGIWGDESWGRFWGWDPKENGALLLCLWLLIVLHGKWGKQLKELGVATMLALTNIAVLLAWFGVNLLSVGLHSYGFTEGAAFYLLIACSAILVLTALPAFIIYIRDATQVKAPQQP